MFYRLNITAVGKCWLVVPTSRWAMPEHRHAVKSPILMCSQVFLTYFNRYRQSKTKEETAKGLPILKIHVMHLIHKRGHSNTFLLGNCYFLNRMNFAWVIGFLFQQHFGILIIASLLWSAAFMIFSLLSFSKWMDNKHQTDNIKSIFRCSSGIIVTSLAYQHRKSLVPFPLLFSDDRTWQIFSF